MRRSPQQCRDSGTPALCCVAVHFKVFVCGILITVDLHISDVPFLWGCCLVDLDESFVDGHTLGPPAQHHDTDNNDDEHSNTSHCNTERAAHAICTLMHWLLVYVALKG